MNEAENNIENTDNALKKGWGYFARWFKRISFWAKVFTVIIALAFIGGLLPDDNTSDNTPDTSVYLDTSIYDDDLVTGQITRCNPIGTGEQAYCGSACQIEFIDKEPRKYVDAVLEKYRCTFWQDG